MDKTIINRKYNYLLERFDKSKKYLKSYKSTEGNEEKELYYSALLRTVEEVLETSIKLNIFVLKQKGKFPKTYKESFKMLEEELQLQDKDFNNLVNLAGFRNLLAHEYMDISYEFTIENIETLHKIFPLYIKSLKKIIDTYH